MTNLGVYLSIIGIVWSIIMISMCLLRLFDRHHRWF